MTTDVQELSRATGGKPVEQYTIRRKVFKIFGAGFHVYHADGSLAGYCKQKAFRLREDLRVYKDDARTQELLRIHTNEIIDVSATYQVLLPSGECIGAFRQHGIRGRGVAAPSREHRTSGRRCRQRDAGTFGEKEPGEQIAIEASRHLAETRPADGEQDAMLRGVASGERIGRRAAAIERGGRAAGVHGAPAPGYARRPFEAEDRWRPRTIPAYRRSWRR